MKIIKNIKYKVGCYSGKIEVVCSTLDDTETVIARARKQLLMKSGGTFPFGYEKFEIKEGVSGK